MGRYSGSRNRSAPKYRFHKATGQAVVTIDGKDRYLGPYDSEESKEKYQRLVAQRNLSQVVKRRQAKVVTINGLIINYLRFCKSHYLKRGELTSEWYSVKAVMQRLKKQHGSTKVLDFGPVVFKEFRETLIAERLKRSTINHYCCHIKWMFERAAEDELIDASLYHRIKLVRNIQMGRSEAVESQDVMPVEQSMVDATIKHLSKQLGDMVRLQLLAGMRPGEVVIMRPCDIDRSGEVWIYRPAQHKTQHHGGRLAKDRSIPLGPRAQELLAKYLLIHHETFCFPSRTNPRYSVSGYRQAIHRAVKKLAPDDLSADEKTEWAKQNRWNPNQLRHTAATNARKHAGLEVAQQVCGHSQMRTTESVYAEIDIEMAKQYARKFG